MNRIVSIGILLAVAVMGFCVQVSGFKTFTIAPAFLEGLDWVKASHTTAAGEIRVAWRREGNGVQLTVTVPPGERSYSAVLQAQ